MSADSIFLKTELNDADKSLWSLLLEHASAEILIKNQFLVPVDELLSQWHVNTRPCDESSLKAALLRLGTGVHYNLKKRAGSGSISGFFVLLESVYIRNGMCHYTFSMRCKEYLCGLRDCLPITTFLTDQRLANKSTRDILSRRAIS